MNSHRRHQPHTNRGLFAAAAGLLVLAGPARLATAEQEVDIEIPVLILGEAGPEVGGTTEIDLANMVQTAAKGVTTVQEAPAIVTVITGDEIRDRNFPDLGRLSDIVPGYLYIGALHSQFPFPATRGVVQSMMYMHNGVSMFDPMVNVPSISRVQPMETIKRVEMITGPGGVLWGANSYMGIMNLITKDAEDVDGIEAQVEVGDGNGDRQTLRGYVMAGIPELFGRNTKLFVHTSFDTFISPGFEMPGHFFSQPTPQPNSINLYGPLQRANPARSMVFNLDGKLGLGPVNLYFQFPYVERHMSLSWPGFVVDKDRVEDKLVACSDGSYALPGQCPAGTTEVGPRCPRPQPGSPDNYYGTEANGYTSMYDQVCLDPDHRSRDNEIDWFDRYLIAEYQTRFLDGKAGVTAKGYFIQFVRDYPQLGVLEPIAGLLEGGLAFGWDGTNYRTGATIDSDLELPGNARLLYGLEGFHEWLPDNTVHSRQGAGVESTFLGPYDLGRLPMGCPVQRHIDPATGQYDGTTEFVPNCPLTFAFQTSRTVMGAYVNPQWKPTKKLILDGGARLQIAPESMGEVGYPLQQIFSGALVYNFAPAWYFKANYAEGFRPPVFNNTNSNGDGVEVAGNPDLKVETSQAYQAEVNARIFKGKRRVRELNFRVDYSYTTLQNTIQVAEGSYKNSGDRGIHSAEFLGRLYLKGGHRIELGYTWLQMAIADRGYHDALPNHWYNLAGIFRLSDKISAMTNLRVLGAMRDPNRIIEYRNYDFDEYGRVYNIDTDERGLISSQPHEMTFDRLPPTADLTLGLTYQATERLRLTAYSYNSLNSRYFQPDPFFDYEPRYEFLPNPYEDFYFHLAATYSY